MIQSLIKASKPSIKVAFLISSASRYENYSLNLRYPRIDIQKAFETVFVSNGVLLLSHDEWP